MGIVAGISAGLIAAGAGAYAASENASATRAAAGATRRNAKNTNEANLLLSLFARGAPLESYGPAALSIPSALQGKSSAILPLYMAGTEADAAKRAETIYNTLTKRSPDQALSDYQALIQKYMPQIMAAEGVGSDIFNGNLTNEMLGYSEPVQAARLEGVETRKNAALQALQSTLNEIDAIQAKKGYTGDSLGSNMLKFNARSRIATNAADDLSAAKMANEQEKQAIKTSGVNLKLSNLDLPNQFLQTALAREDLPAQSVSKSFQTALTPFSMFNLGPGQYTQFQQLPAVQAVPSDLAIALQGVGSVAGGLSSMGFSNALNNQALSNANQNYFSTNYGSANMPTNYSSLPVGQQANYNYMYGQAQRNLSNPNLYPQGALTFQ